DVDADGIVISEGHGALVLKRRDDAERDGDKIYALLRGVAAGSDGRSKGLTAPRLEGQIRTLKRAYETAGIDPTTVGLFEAHGTGTAVGDQTECLALSTYLKSAGARSRSAAIGSIKSGIGHTKCAAGVAGIIKATLALGHRVLPPTMHVENPNPKAGFGDGPLYVNSESRPWIQAAGPRRAGVSSFGFGGTNFHTILEEYQSVDGCQQPSMRQQLASEVFTFSSESAPGLLASVNQFADQLGKAIKSAATAPLERIAYAHHLRQGNTAGLHRLAIVSTDAADLLAKLNSFSAACGSDGVTAKKMLAGVHHTSEPIGRPAPIAFLFPGQGSQYPNMLRDLAVEFQEVSGCFQRAEQVLSSELDQSLSDLVFPPPEFNEAEKADAAERLKATRFAQPALGTCGIAMLRLLNAFGVRPAFAGGHSFGELIALCAAGSISEPTLFRLAAARGRAMTIGDPATSDAGLQDNGQMLAVSADAASVKQLLAGIHEVWLANRNGPKQTVVSGTRTGIALAVDLLNSAGIATKLLPVAAAFHSPLMKSAQQRFQASLLETQFAPPRFAVYSNVTADKYPEDEATIRSLLSEQILSEVQFVEEIQRLYRDGARIFIEAGPKAVLTGLVGDILRDRTHLAVSTQPSGTDGVTGFMNT
ncbi:MAG TPA: acyltransferase domain-containing protein, partial [Pirellulales bacterium]